MVSPATRVNVRRITSQDTWEVGLILGASHADDPAFRQGFPDAAQRGRVVRAVLAAAAHDVELRGLGYLARVRGVAVGAVLWLPPGTPRRDGWAAARLAASMLPAAWAGGRRFVAFARAGAALDRAALAEEGWYLRALGVIPRQQGRGIGARLLGPTLEAADSHGVTCGLHTSDPANVSYFERFGFVAVEDLRPIISYGPTYLRMRRQPQ